MTVKTPAPPPLPDELDRLLRRLRMPYVRQRRAGGDRDRRPRSAGSPPRSCGSCSPRRPPAATRRRSGCAAARPGCRPARPSTPGTENASPIPDGDPAGAAHAGVDRPRRERSASADRAAPARATSSRRSGTSRSTSGKTVAWHTLEIARGAAAPPPRRRQRRQGDRPADPRRSDRDRRHRHAPGRARRRRSAVPRRRRRLRETLDRAHQQHPPGRLRRADAQDPRRPPPSTGCCTTRTSCSPTAPTATGSPRRPPARG